jgi:hypothetical protein
VSEPEMPVVFTPYNEPYLGRELLLAFDQLIAACLEFNAKCAPKSHNVVLTDFQNAACILMPQVISIALSIRELIRQGYVFGAKVLVRPFVERAVTLYYLHTYPEDLGLWNDGWDYKKRPSLYTMLERIRARVSASSPQFPKVVTFEWNSATHGDPFSSRWNVAIFNGVVYQPVSKNLKAPNVVDEVCAEAIPWLAATMGMMGAAFGKDEGGTIQ